MDGAIIDILDSCIAQLEAGSSIEECLAGYPRQRAELEGALMLATALRQLPRPPMPATTRASLETRMLAQAAARRAAQGQNGAPRSSRPAGLLDRLPRMLGYRGAVQPWMRLASIALAALLALVLGAGAFAAARAIVRLVAPAPTSAPSGDTAPFTLDGPIAQIDQEAWVVAGEAVAINARTAISGAPAVGAIAHVRGVARADGALIAQRIVIDAATPAAPVTAPPAATPVPTAAPPSASPAPPPQTKPGDGGKPDDDPHSCQGEQRGRDDKKCDPRRPPKPKDDKGGKRGR